MVGGVWDSFYLFVKGVKEDEVKRRGKKKRLEGGFLFARVKKAEKKNSYQLVGKACYRKCYTHVIFHP